MTFLPDGCTKPKLVELDAFWTEARQSVAHHNLAETYQVRWIGLDEETTRQILELIILGDKTGTFTLPWLVGGPYREVS